MSIEALHNCSYQSGGVTDRIATGKLQILESDLEMVESNSKARSAWVMYAEALLCENFLSPPIRSSGRLLPYYAIPKASAAIIEKEEASLASYLIPREFETIYAKQEGSAIGKRRLKISPLQEIQMKCRDPNEVIFHIALSFDLEVPEVESLMPVVMKFEDRKENDKWLV